jgi:hypothetical protein
MRSLRLDGWIFIGMLPEATSLVTVVVDQLERRLKPLDASFVEEIGGIRSRARPC